MKIVKLEQSSNLVEGHNVHTLHLMGEKGRGQEGEKGRGQEGEKGTGQGLTMKGDSASPT